jgi:glycosyltransferase involved in cell wall biosynthesis
MSLPLVTVVVPIFNQSGFIVETIDSLLHQSHTNLQIIVVDDGSSDNGSEIALAKFGKSIELIRQKNLGPSAAINAGLSVARGDFIALNGGDDVSLTNRVALQLEIISATQHDIIFSKPLLINGEGQSIEDKEFPVFFKERKGSILQDLLLEGNFFCASSAMMHRDVIQKVGLFNTALIQLQDYDYWLRAAAAGLSLAEIEPRVVKYRRHKTNLSGHDNGFASSAEFLMIVKSILALPSPRAIRTAFPYVFEPTTDLDSPLTQLDRSIFLLAHPIKEIRMAGVEFAASLFKDQEFAKKAERVGFDVFRYSFNSSKS